MFRSFVDSAARADGPQDHRVVGVTVARVLENVCDAEEQGNAFLARVKLQLPWLSDIQPWARVAVPMAGPGRGLYIMPQVGDEVLVAFNHGDVREPYVLGSLWNGQDAPPIEEPEDAVNKRILRTPEGHVIELDDADETQSITVTSIRGHKITIGQDKIEMETADGLKITMDDDEHKVSIEAQEITLDAAGGRNSLQADTIEIAAGQNVQMTGNSACEIQAGQVRIN